MAVAAYLEAAIEIQDSREIITPKRGRPVAVPPELGRALDDNPEARAAFENMTPGKRREYADHVAEAKREETKVRRIEKVLPMIRSGVGLHEKYRDR